MTDAELQGIALQALNMMKRDVEQNGRGWLLASYHAGEGLHRMAKIEALTEEKLGRDWLDHDRAKDIGFGMLRLAISFMPPDAVVFVTATNMFRPTEAFRRLDKEKQQKIMEIMEQSSERRHEAVREGLLALQDSFTATAQTPARVCIYTQAVDHGVSTGPPELHFFDQQNFDGRMKMYGEGLGGGTS